MIRAATNADKKGWKAYTKSLKNYWRKLELAAGRSVLEPDKFLAALDRMKAPRG